LTILVPIALLLILVLLFTSATNEPKSRPRTLEVTTTRRLPFSGLI
jgi:hypothetical protein